MTGTELRFPFPDPRHAGPEEQFSSRGDGPLRPVVLASGVRAFLVCGYEELRVLLTGNSFSRAQATEHGITSRSPQSLALNTADPPDHGRRRGTVAAAFTRPRAAKEREWIHRMAADLLCTMTKAGPPADLIVGFSLPLSVAVICRILDVPAADFPFFSPLVDVMMSTAGHTAQSIADAHQGMFDYFSRLYDEELTRLAEGQTRRGVLADLVIAAERDRTVTRTEAVHIAYGLLIAGYETITRQVATSVLLLLSNRRRWEQLCRDPSGLDPAIEETLRWTALSAGGAPHATLEDVAIGKEQVPAGQILIPVFAVANRDPRVFANPDRLCLDRAGPPHVAFGHGRHMCLGAPLARVELQVAIGTLVHGLPGLELAVPEQKLSWREGAFVRGLTALPVRW